jgi:hypothetical protein
MTTFATWVYPALGVLLLSSCAVEGDGAPQAGRLEMQARVSDPTGTAWTIIGETFLIRDEQGNLITSFEEEPGQPMKILLLDEGAYTIELSGDFHLQTTNASSIVADHDWILEERAPIAFTVSRTRVARVVFHFVRKNGATFGFELGPRQLLSAFSADYTDYGSEFGGTTGLGGAKMLMTPSVPTCAEDSEGGVTTTTTFDAHPIELAVDPESPAAIVSHMTGVATRYATISVNENEGEQYVFVQVGWDGPTFNLNNVIFEGTLDAPLPIDLEGCPILGSFDVGAGEWSLNLGGGFYGYMGGSAAFAFR